MGLIAWRKRATPGVRFIAGALFSAAVYAFGYGLELSSSSLEAILICLQIEYLGIVWLPGLWLAMALRYTNQLWWLKPPRFYALWVIPVIVLAAFTTNPFHHLYYTNITLDTGGPFPMVQFDHGPIYILQIGYILFTLVTSSILLFRYLLLPHFLYRRQVHLILSSNILVLLVVTLYFAGLQPVPNLDIVVYAVILSSAIVGLGLVRYRMTDLVPVAREALFDRLSDAVLVLDGEDRLIDYNPQASRLLDLQQNSIGSLLPALLAPQLIPAFEEIRCGSESREFSLARPDTRHYQVVPSVISGASLEKEGLIVVIHEITQLKQMQIALEKNNDVLDKRVKLQTQEYLQTIDRLEEEIQIRGETEQKLQEMQDSLVERVSAQSRKLYSLYDVLINVEGAGETGEILIQTLARIMQMMNAGAACIHEARSGKLYRIGSVGLPEQVTDAIEVLPGDWLEEGKPLVSTSLPDEERVPDSLRIAQFTGYLAAPIRLQETFSGVLQVFWQEPHDIQVEDISYFTIIAEQLGVIIENDRLRKKLADKAVQVERRRLARDLHDSVTQSLHSLLLNVGILSNRIAQGRMEKVDEMLVRLDHSAHQALKEMRLLLFELRLAPLEDIRLVEALQNRLEAVELRAGIDARLQAGQPADWPLKWEAEMYCIAMEALNNSLKHARASQVQVDLRGQVKWVEMCITDNGKGLSPESYTNNGFGLQSMSERAERLGGRLMVESAEGQGTRIRLLVGRPPVEVKGP